MICPTGCLLPFSFWLASLPYGTTRTVSVPLIDTPPFVLPFNTASVSLVDSFHPHGIF